MYGPKQARQQALRRGTAARQRVMAEAMKRKEEYLGARVPKELKEKVIIQAQELGIPVSILIRNVLEEAFGGGQTLEGGAKRPSRSTERHQKDTARRAVTYPSVLGWEAMSLNKEMACSGCGKRLEAGAQVTLGIALPGEAHTILCELCKESL